MRKGRNIIISAILALGVGGSILAVSQGPVTIADGPVHIEITGDDGGPATSETGQLADGVLSDRGHSTSLSPHTFAKYRRGLWGDGTPAAATAPRRASGHARHPASRPLDSTYARPC